MYGIINVLKFQTIFACKKGLDSADPNENALEEAV